jgi:hypothetical protein
MELLSTTKPKRWRKKPEEKREEKIWYNPEKPMHKEVSTQNRRGGC